MVRQVKVSEAGPENEVDKCEESGGNSKMNMVHGGGPNNNVGFDKKCV